jgi:hypothetical protein
MCVIVAGAPSQDTGNGTTAAADPSVSHDQSHDQHPSVDSNRPLTDGRGALV